MERLPLVKGKSNKVKSANIKEIMGSYKQKGTIGTSAPKSKKKAQLQAIAIALNTARHSKVK